MSDTNRFTVSISPHVRSGETVTGIMLDVIIALIPAVIAAAAIFGPRAAIVIGVSVGVSVFTEYLSNKIMKKSGTIGDLSAVVTGILLALNMPVTIPLWMLAIGAVVAVLVVKQFFGGIGQNFVNPAIAGRIVLLVSFPAAMTNFTDPFTWERGVDALTTATPLASLAPDGFDAALAQGTLPNLTRMFFGQTGGCIGEVCSAALIVGGLYLVSRRVISLRIPLSFVGAFAFIMLAASGGDPLFTAYQVLSGGLLLGAIFMATDYSTSPIGKTGKIVFGIGCGVITALIRLFGNLPEGVSYAIIIMNILCPLIERASLPKPFGTEKPKKSKEGAAV